METAARHGHLLPGAPPTDQILTDEGQIFLSGILFFWHQTILCCPNTIGTTEWKWRGVEKRNTSHPITLPHINVLKFPFPARVPDEENRPVGTVLGGQSRHPRACPGQHPILTFPGTNGQIDALPAGQETDHQKCVT